MHAAVADFRAVPPRLIDEATVLLRRYPQISSEEESRLLAIYPKLSVVQVALMRSDEELAPRLMAFRKAHSAEARSPERGLVPRIVPALLLLVALAWAIFN